MQILSWHSNWKVIFMRYYLLLLALFINGIGLAQQEFHVFPVKGESKKGSPDGNGSLDRPWDLQTALSQSSERVNGGDIIWLHEGVYKGRYKSSLKSNNEEFITVSAFKEALVVIDGNAESNEKQVFEVKGDKVIFKNFEITFKGQFSRSDKEKAFKRCDGLIHLSGVAKFQNLKIYNNPGLGVGSWKHTGGTIIEDCLIYYNGFIKNGRGLGEGMYVQNNSDAFRIIRNNIIFGNFYKGIEVWSASTRSKGDFIKNVILENNIVFNNGVPSGRHWGNIIVATNDKQGHNIARNIKLIDNVLYHNVDFLTKQNSGNASSLALGFIKQSPVKNILVSGNTIIGKNNAFSIVNAESLVLENNSIFTGYVHIDQKSLPNLSNGKIYMSGNKYYSKNKTPFRILKYKDYKFKDWKGSFKLDLDSEWYGQNEFEIDPVLKLSELNSKPNHFNVALLEKNASDVLVDFSEYEIKEGTPYEVYDIENRKVMLVSGKLGKDRLIKFRMNLSDFEKPINNSIATKSKDNFNVYRIVFKEKEIKKKKGFFKRLFAWIF